MRRNDVTRVEVTYADGTSTVLEGEDIRVAVARDSISMEGEKRDRQEWDLFEVRIAGPLRPVRHAQ